MSFTESPASKAVEVKALRVECAPKPLIPDLTNTDLIHLAIVLEVTCLLGLNIEVNNI